MQGSPYKNSFAGWLPAPAPRGPFNGDNDNQETQDPRPCTPGSISYREEMDERRAKNLLVFGFPAKGAQPLLKPHAPKREFTTTELLVFLSSSDKT